MRYLVLIFLLLIAVPSFAENSVLKFGAGDEYYEIVIQNDRIVGGYAQGSKRFDVWGGAKIGDRMHVLFRRSDGFTGDYAWWAHSYRINNGSVVLETSVAKSGKVLTNRNAKYRIIEYSRR